MNKLRNMKKVIVIIALIVAPIISGAQSIFDKFEDMPEVASVIVNQKMFSMIASIDWVVENMNDDGSFLYFYDGSRDTKVDLDHPRMVDPLYNNILRHSGGTITVLKAYEYTKDKKYLNAAKKSLEFFISTFREHEYNG